MGKDDKSDKDKRKKKDKEKKSKPSKPKAKDKKKRPKDNEKNSESSSDVQEMDLFAEPGNTGPHPTLPPANEAKDNADELIKESVQAKIRKIEELSENEKIRNLLQGDLLEKLKKFFKKEEDEGLKLAAFSKVLDELEKGRLNGKSGTDCVTYLIGELNAPFYDLYGHFACHILDRFFDDSRHDGAVFMFLPKLLSGISEQERIWADGFASNGSEYKTHVIETICEKKWPKGLVTILLTNLRDVELTEKELEVSTAKFIQSLNEIDIEELPSLVYQLLLFSVKGNQEQILQGVTGHFVRAKSREGPQLTKQRHIEGTILHHLDIAMKRDQNLPNLYLKLVKNAKIRLSPFTIALLLLLARGKNQTAIFDFIKDVLLKEFQGIKPNSIPWLDAEEGAVKHLEENGSVETSLFDVVENSQFGWNLAFCLVDLGILLMDTPIPKISEVSQQHSKQIIMTGNVILQRTFKYHELIRKKVFDTILARVVTRDGNSTFYVSLLKCIIQSSLDDMSDLAPKIKQIFDCLPSILPSVAVQIVNSTQPIIHMNKSVQDHLVLVLRKSIFQREIDTRIVALTCFLELLQDSEYARVYANEEFGNEILGFLRRCFSQQSIVRKELYLNLFKTFENNKNLRESIIDLLLTQFKVYVKGDADEVLDFSQLIHGKPQNGPIQPQNPDGVYFIEPFHILLHYLCRCIHLECHEKKVPNYIKNPSNFINLFINNMLKSELEEYELDKSSTFDINTLQGNYNQHAAYLLLSIYEGLIEYLVTGLDAKGKYKKILGLYEKILQIKSAIKLSFKEKPATQPKNNGKKKGSKKGAEKDLDNSELISHESEEDSESESTTHSEKRRGGKKSVAMLKEFSHPPNLSYNCIISLVELCNRPIEEFENSSDESLIALKKKFSFIQWVLEAAVSHLKEFPKSSVPQDESTNKIRANFCLKVAKPAFEMFFFYGGKEQKEEGKSLSCLALECFELCTRYIADTGKLDLIAQYLKAVVVAEKDDDDNLIEEEDDDGSDAFIIHTNIVKLEKVLWEVLSGDINVYKYGLVLMELISLLSEFLPKKIISTHSVFVDRVCQKEIQNVPFAKAVITAYSKLSDKMGSLKLYENVMHDLHIELGDNMIENENLFDGKSARFKIINSQTKSVIALIIIQRLSTQLTQIYNVWEAIHQSIRLKKLKQKVNYTNPQQQQQREAITLEAKELKSTQKLIFTRIMGVLTTLFSLISSLAPTQIAQQSIKLITQIYKVIGNFYKDLEIIFISTKLTPSKKFEELIKYMGQQFTQKVYQFLVVVDPSISGKAGCNSEMRLMPSLVFEIENFEGATIKFEQLTGMRLYSEFRRSTARDFQIKFSAKTEEDDDEDDGKGKKGKKKSSGKEKAPKKKARKNNDEENEENEDEPKKKRKKKNH